MRISKRPVLGVLMLSVGIVAGGYLQSHAQSATQTRPAATQKGSSMTTTQASTSTRPVFDRAIPQLPAKGQKIRLLIDSDTANEVDDQYAIALALLSPEKFAIEGFVATHFGDSGGPTGTEMSAKEIELLLDKAGDGGEVPGQEGGGSVAVQFAPAAVGRGGLHY